MSSTKDTAIALINRIMDAASSLTVAKNTAKADELVWIVESWLQEQLAALREPMKCGHPRACLGRPKSILVPDSRSADGLCATDVEDDDADVCSFCAELAAMTKRAEEAEKSVGLLDLALQHSTTRYSQDHGEPEPTPSFPIEVVFTMREWQGVLHALAAKDSSNQPRIEAE